MATNDHVHLSAKAIPDAQARSHAIVINAPCPKEHRGALWYGAAAHMDTAIGGAVAIGEKCADIKGGGAGKIWGGHQVWRPTAHLAPRVSRTGIGPIEDSDPDRIGGVGREITGMQSGPEFVPGAIESCCTQGENRRAHAGHLQLSHLKSFSGLPEFICLGRWADPQQAYSAKEKAEDGPGPDGVVVLHGCAPSTLTMRFVRRAAALCHGSDGAS